MSWEDTVSSAQAGADQIYAAMREGGPELGDAFDSLTLAVAGFILVMRENGIPEPQIAAAIASLTTNVLLRIERRETL